MNRLELVTETLRATLNHLAQVAPGWLRLLAPADWYERYAHRVEESRLPKGEAARKGSAEQVGQDGFAVLLPRVVRTWARVGRIPVLKTPTKYEHLSVASAITMTGKLLTQIRASAFNGAAIVGFLKHLLSQITRKAGTRASSC
jgi:hypothetical protein